MNTTSTAAMKFSVEVVILPVRDVNRALRFYVDQVGFTCCSSAPSIWRPTQNCSRKAAKYDLRECATSNAFFERSENRVRAQGPLWVISRHSPTLGRCLLYPQKRTLISRVVMSALCQKRTLCAAANSRHSITSSECASRG
jgi:hypothetical protein